MQELPKIALARLKGKSTTPKTAAPAESDSSFPGGEHPDANLLAAFAEKSLTEKEHAQVLHHLSQCADCRVVAAFALPEEPAEPVPARVAAPRSWYAWPVVRWGALAAALGTLTMVVVLHPGIWNRPAEVSERSAPPPVPTGGLPSPRAGVRATAVDGSEQRGSQGQSRVTSAGIGRGHECGEKTAGPTKIWR